MKALAAVKTWEKTKVQFLVRHKSGRYYARLFQNGKETWKTLKTDHQSIAQARLAELLKEHRGRKGKQIDPANAKMTFADAAELDQQKLDEELSLKCRTRKYYREVPAALLESWPGLAETELRRITPMALKAWAIRYGKMFSASRYNGTLSLLRRILRTAVESGVIYSNPAAGLERKAQKARHLELPTCAQFAGFIEAMQNAQTRDSHNCADLAQGLAFTGCRISESARIEWRDLDFRGGEIVVKGDPEEGTKNGEIRREPMIPQARALFTRMREARAHEAPTEKVFLVRECQHSMDRAAAKVGMPRITHHDLRHFFSTVSIESGVDIPTVARWLGHKDGGALAMRTYGHFAARAQCRPGTEGFFCTNGSLMGALRFLSVLHQFVSTPCGLPTSRTLPSRQSAASSAKKFGLNWLTCAKIFPRISPSPP